MAADAWATPARLLRKRQSDCKFPGHGDDKVGLNWKRQRSVEGGDSNDAPVEPGCERGHGKGCADSRETKHRGCLPQRRERSLARRGEALHQRHEGEDADDGHTPEPALTHYNLHELAR